MAGAAAGVCGEHDHRQELPRVGQARQLLQQRIAVQFRHLQIQQDQVRRECRHQAHDPLRVGGGDHLLEAFALQQVFEQPHIGRLVVDDEDAGGEDVVACHASSLSITVKNSATSSGLVR